MSKRGGCDSRRLRPQVVLISISAAVPVSVSASLSSVRPADTVQTYTVRLLVPSQRVHMGSRPASFPAPVCLYSFPTTATHRRPGVTLSSAHCLAPPLPAA